ncbi:MAG TPA: hypothetical protein VNH64_12040, partial [Parvularculaceae bacterium]|nr:hypothetical protein [Parvularculaceae bacterium]
MTAQIHPWRYSAEDAAGNVVAGILDAENLTDAMRALRLQNLRPLSLRRAAPALGALFGARARAEKS